MGIPYYFRKIVNDFPNVIKVKSILDENSIYFHNVFLDFNCCIHGCSNELKSSDIIFNSTEHFETELIKKVLIYIDNIFDFVNPKELFYISIDGIPPRSKMVQQRNRRFMSSWKKNKLLNVLEKNKCSVNDINKIKNEWNSNAISPGTDFMNNLSKAIQNKINTEKKYKYIKTILSDSHENGEGEYKIFKYINDNKLNSLQKNNLIYGLDADLIMLSLLNDSNIYLLREPLHLELNNNDKFLYLSIVEFKQNLKLFYKDYFPIDTDNLIKYYIFLCFLLGNDFIPHLSFLNFKTLGLENLLINYKKISNELNENIIFIQNNKKSFKYIINYNFLIKLFNYLSKIEDQELFKISEKYYNKRPYVKKYDNQIEHYSNLLELYPIYNKPDDLIKFGTDGWRTRYYYNIFNTINGKDIRDISHNYLESIQFTLDYYFHQKYHHTWYYRYNNAPTILDLYNYLLSFKLKKNEEDLQNDESIFKINIDFCELYPNIDITIPLQLLMILPPSSIYLIKNKKHKELMTDINKGVLHYYPINFQVETHLKNWLWLCHPKLPDIDITYLNSKI